MSTVKWVLDPKTMLAGSFLVRERVIFICPSVFNDQAGMNRAVFRAWEAVSNPNWIVDRLIQLAADAVVEPDVANDNAGRRRNPA